MEGLDLVLWPPTAWHWLALALILFSIEMMTGTWDLLWVSIAAAVTSAFAAFAPSSIAGWEGQLIFFAVATVVLFIVGRTLFKSMRESIEEHPTLNKRMAGTLGQRGVVADDFAGGLAGSNWVTRYGPRRAWMGQTLRVDRQLLLKTPKATH